jgi:hypothetical protein
MTPTPTILQTPKRSTLKSSLSYQMSPPLSSLMTLSSTPTS